MQHVNKPRRTFLQLGTTGVVSAVLASLSKISFAQSASEPKKAIVVHPEEGTRILSRRKVPITIKISKAKQGIDSISFCMEEMTPGLKMRVHKHLHHDELIFVHRGEGTITLDEQSIAVKTGAVIFVPRGIWHGLDNTGEETLLMVFGYSPAGFEEFFLENGTPEGMPPKERTEAELEIVAKKYGMIYK